MSYFTLLSLEEEKLTVLAQIPDIKPEHISGNKVIEISMGGIIVGAELPGHLEIIRNTGLGRALEGIGLTLPGQ